RLSLPACPVLGVTHTTRPGAGQLLGPGPRPGIRGQHVLQRHRVLCRALMLRDYLRDRIHDPGERDPARPERPDADLIGRVVDGGGGAPGAARLRASPTAGNASSSRGWKVQVCALVQSSAGPAPG